MQPEIQISLVIPVGSQVGPFDLYSNVDGYVTPFETGINASEFVYPGYITTPPDGTDYVRVQSGNLCETFVTIENLCQPITTTTTSSSTSTTTTSTSSTSTTSTTTIYPDCKFGGCFIEVVNSNCTWMLPLRGVEGLDQVWEYNLDNNTYNSISLSNGFGGLPDYSKGFGAASSTMYMSYLLSIGEIKLKYWNIQSGMSYINQAEIIPPANRIFNSRMIAVDDNTILLTSTHISESQPNSTRLHKVEINNDGITTTVTDLFDMPMVYEYLRGATFSNNKLIASYVSTGDVNADWKLGQWSYPNGIQDIEINTTVSMPFSTLSSGSTKQPFINDGEIYVVRSGGGQTLYKVDLAAPYTVTEITASLNPLGDNEANNEYVNYFSSAGLCSNVSFIKE